jgi:hypothetical protein
VVTLLRRLHGHTLRDAETDMSLTSIPYSRAGNLPSFLQKLLLACLLGGARTECRQIVPDHRGYMLPVLQVAQVGDALAPSAAVEGGSAGIIVDLFADGQLIPQLTQVSSTAYDMHSVC